MGKNTVGIERVDARRVGGGGGGGGVGDARTEKYQR